MGKKEENLLGFPENIDMGFRKIQRWVPNWC